jgi:two-component system nitrogen regulation response regulator NtrX
MVPGRVIRMEVIPAPFNRTSDIRTDLESHFVSGSLKEAKGEFEKAFIEAKLREFNGNISQTSEAIGIERSNLHKKIKGYKLDKIK